MGITWVKDAGNPIITQGTPGNWDYGRIETGSIIYTPSELRIYYDGSGPATGNLGRIGLATAPYKLPLQPGTYTVGTNGIFATIQDAFDKLDTDGVAGNVTLELKLMNYTQRQQIPSALNYELDQFPVQDQTAELQLSRKNQQIKMLLLKEQEGVFSIF